MQTVKMVVTGPFNAGKTEFIRSVSEIDVVSTERKITSEAERVKETTTVAMDFGRMGFYWTVSRRITAVAVSWVLAAINMGVGSQLALLKGSRAVTVTGSP